MATTRVGPMSWPRSRVVLSLALAVKCSGASTWVPVWALIDTSVTLAAAPVAMLSVFLTWTGALSGQCTMPSLMGVVACVEPGRGNGHERMG